MPCVNFEGVGGERIFRRLPRQNATLPYRVYRLSLSTWISPPNPFYRKSLKYVKGLAIKKDGWLMLLNFWGFGFFGRFGRIRFKPLLFLESNPV
jgi:hypothetical protein